jgi:hypothetical protein
LLLTQSGIKTDPKGQDTHHINETQRTEQVPTFMFSLPNTYYIFKGKKTGDNPLNPYESGPGADIQTASGLCILQFDKI